MIEQYQIENSVQWEGLKDFGRFIISISKKGYLPDFEKIDLMSIPKLVPHIWVYDLRTEGKMQKLIVNFAGEEHTRLHGYNMCGKSDIEIFQGYGLGTDVTDHFHHAISEKCAVYNRRHVNENLDDGTISYRNVESLFFPCSTDGETINWGIGCLKHNAGPLENEPACLYFS